MRIVGLKVGLMWSGTLLKTNSLLKLNKVAGTKLPPYLQQVKVTFQIIPASIPCVLLTINKDRGRSCKNISSNIKHIFYSQCQVGVILSDSLIYKSYMQWYCKLKLKWLKILFVNWKKSWNKIFFIIYILDENLNVQKSFFKENLLIWPL